MRNLNAMTIFVRTAESRSFTGGANRLGISASAVSKSISSLEEELGVLLVNRNNRKFNLTEEGADFFERCRHILSEISQAESAITQGKSVPRGKLHIKLPVVFGRRIILPALYEFLADNPSILMDVELSDRSVDVIKEGFDVIVGVGKQADSGLIARKLCNIRFIACAAPSYLQSHGEPKTTEALNEHKCLSYLDVKSGKYRPWYFAKEGKRFSKNLHGHLNLNNAEAILDAAIAGAGIASMASFIAAEALASKQLKIILRDYWAKGPAVYVMYPTSRHLSPRIRKFVDFLSALVPENPPWDREFLA